MKLDTTTRYGFRLVANIGGDNQVKSLTEVSKQENISRKYLEQIILKLRKNNLIEGHMGIKGGYSLTRSPDKISLYEVYKALSDREHIIYCLDPQDPCKREKGCKTIHLWRCIDSGIIHILKNHTIEDLVKENIKFNGFKKG